MQKTLRIAVVDDHPMVRAGVVHVLSQAKTFEIVAEGQTGSQAIEIVRTQHPDVLVLDLSMPDGGLNALAAIQSLGTATKVLMLTVSDDEANVFRALDLGASGYVLKGIGGDELIQAIRMVHNNGRYLSPELGGKILAEMARQNSSQGNESEMLLNEREQRVCKLAGSGFSNREIADQLQLSEKTVKYYLTRIFKKLKIRNRVELSILYQQHGSEKFLSQSINPLQKT